MNSDWARKELAMKNKRYSYHSEHFKDFEALCQEPGTKIKHFFLLLLQFWNVFSGEISLLQFSQMEPEVNMFNILDNHDPGFYNSESTTCLTPFFVLSMHLNIRMLSVLLSWLTNSAATCYVVQNVSGLSGKYRQDPRRLGSRRARPIG